MPDERVAIQPPSVECVKVSGKWPSVQPLGVELRLEVAGRTRRPARARAARWRRSSSTRFSRPQVDRDHRARLVRRRPRGCRRCSCRRRTGSPRRRRRAPPRTTAATSSSSAGAHDDVGEPAEVAAALADEVAQALAARVDDAVERRRWRRARPDGVLERGAQARPGAAAPGSSRSSKRDGARAGARRRRGRGSRSMNGAELRLVLVGERDALVAPAPPLHRRRCHPYPLPEGLLA